LVAKEIKDFISIKERLVYAEDVIRFGCNVFASTNLDFIDCLPVAYASVEGNSVFSFDDLLNRQLGHKAFNQSR